MKTLFLGIIAACSVFVALHVYGVEPFGFFKKLFIVLVISAVIYFIQGFLIDLVIEQDAKYQKKKAERDRHAS